MDATLPNFVIIGAMKCATSTLHEQLARQPGIFMSEPKEPNFFSNDEIYAKGLSWYQALFTAGRDQELRGESSTHYTKLPTYPKTLARMRALLPSLKMVYVMRHPIDRLISHYVHDWSERLIDTPLESAVDSHPQLIDYGCYYRQLAPFIETYGRQNILPVFLERLQRDPQAELERVCRFLGYAGQPRWVEEVAHLNAGSGRMRLGKLGVALLIHPVLARLRKSLLPKALRDTLKAWLTMRERPELSPAKRRVIEARFDRDLERLGYELGTSLSCANFKERVSGEPLGWVG